MSSLFQRRNSPRRRDLHSGRNCLLYGWFSGVMMGLSAVYAAKGMDWGFLIYAAIALGTFIMAVRQAEKLIEERRYGPD